MFRDRRQDDFEEEIRSHIDIETDRLMRQGMTAEEARFAARRAFGNVGVAQQRFHEAHRFRWLWDLGTDVRYASRMLRKSPGFTFVAVLTLALGIGATTAVFSVVNSVLLRPLPYQDPDRIVRLWETLPNIARIQVSYPDYLDWKARTRVFEAIGLYMPYGSMSLTGGDVPERVGVGYASANLFPLLGLTPTLGRHFKEAEDRHGAERVALLTHAWWVGRFGADSGIIGRRLTLDGDVYSVVGIIPPTVGLGRLDLWIPVGLFEKHPAYTRGNHPGLSGIARLKPGVTIEQMNADLERVASGIRAEHPREAAGVGAGGDFLVEDLVGDVRPSLRLFAWAVGLVLLIACVNVANLLLGRSTSRRREVAVRTAVGASRGRILRLLLVENLLLALGGGALGVALAYGGVTTLVALRPGIPRIQGASVDTRVMVFAALLAIVTGVIFGALPARRAARVDLTEALKETTRGSSSSRAPIRARGALMVIEVAMAMMLLVGAGLLIRSFARLRSVDPGVDPNGVVIGRINLPASKYSDEPRQREAMAEIVRRAGSLPGVSAAAISSALPLASTIQNRMTFEGHPRPKGSEPLINVNFVTPDYFATMRMRVLAGRGIAPTDGSGKPLVAVIGESVAKRFFPGENPLGKRIVHGSFESTEPPWIVVGVVNDVNEYGLASKPDGIVYLSLSQRPMPWGTLSVRSELPAERLLPAIRREIAAMDRDLPLANTETLAEIIGESMNRERFVMFVLTVFAGVALVLAVVGVYGVIAYFVAQRSHEIGIRMALGAQRADIAALVGGRVLGTTAVGVAIGVAGALAGGRVMSKLLYDIAPTDVATFVVGALSLIGAAALASAVPTLRATRVNPASTMRSD